MPKSSSSSSSTSSKSSNSPSPKASMDSQRRGASVEVMRCSRCAKTVETVTRSRSGVSSAEAASNGMIRFGHNLYYCDRCARMVGYT